MAISPYNYAFEQLHSAVAFRAATISTLRVAFLNHYVSRPELSAQAASENMNVFRRALPTPSSFKDLVTQTPVLNRILWMSSKITVPSWDQSVSNFLRFVVKSHDIDKDQMPFELEPHLSGRTPWMPSKIMRIGVLLFLSECLCEASANPPDKEQDRILRMVSRPFETDQEREEAWGYYADVFFGGDLRQCHVLIGGHLIFIGRSNEGIFGNQTSESLARVSWTPQWPLIRQIDMKLRSLNDEDVEAIATMLRHPQIVSLDLYENSITSKGAKLIARALRGSQVKKMGFCLNRAGLSGIRAIADAVRDSRIRHLTLWENQIDDDGARIIARSLPDTDVESLELLGNQIGDAGAEAIADSLRRSRIKSLDLRENLIGADEIKRIQDLCLSLGIDIKI